MLNNCSIVRMTASRAAEMFRTATPITAAELTEQHIDMLQMSDISIHARAALGEASDALRVDNRRAPAVQMCVATFNALVRS